MRLRVHDTELIRKRSFICSHIESRAVSWWSAHNLSVVVRRGSIHQVKLLFLKMLHLELVVARILFFCCEWVHLIHLLIAEHLIVIYAVSLALTAHTDGSALYWNEICRFIPHLLWVCHQVNVGVTVLLCKHVFGCI